MPGAAISWAESVVMAVLLALIPSSTLRVDVVSYFASGNPVRLSAS